MDLPAISVIIPMYNAEKYIGECLDSILAQTFQNFEVIVVDDCSTDNSVAVVKNYTARFGGRLKLTRTKKNSGGCAVPRNVGLPFSIGEYIFFLDADDTITPTAFEELYSVAKDFDADVVACEKYYEIPAELWNDIAFRMSTKPTSYKTDNLVDKPTLVTDNFFERVQSYYNRDFVWNVWTKLIRRDFILENAILFEDTLIEDVIFTGCLVFTAKKFVLVPNVINYYRFIEGSVSHMTTKNLAYFRKYVKALVPAFRHFDSFLSETDFFRQNPAEKYLALETVWNEATGYVIPMYGQIPVHEFDDILREEFFNGDNLALTAFSFNAANAYYRQLIYNRGEIAELRDLAAQSQQYIAELENEIRRLNRR